MTTNNSFSIEELPYLSARQRHLLHAMATADRVQYVRDPLQININPSNRWGEKKWRRREELVPGGRGGRPQDGLSDSWCEATTG
jgi:hypothetical protein